MKYYIKIYLRNDIIICKQNIILKHFNPLISTIPNTFKIFLYVYILNILLIKYFLKISV